MKLCWVRLDWKGVAVLGEWVGVCSSGFGEAEVVRGGVWRMVLGGLWFGGVGFYGTGLRGKRWVGTG